MTLADILQVLKTPVLALLPIDSIATLRTVARQDYRTGIAPETELRQIIDAFNQDEDSNTLGFGVQRHANITFVVYCLLRDRQRQRSLQRWSGYLAMLHRTGDIDALPLTITDDDIDAMDEGLKLQLRTTEMSLLAARQYELIQTKCGPFVRRITVSDDQRLVTSFIPSAPASLLPTILPLDDLPGSLTTCYAATGFLDGAGDDTSTIVWGYPLRLNDRTSAGAIAKLYCRRHPHGHPELQANVRTAKIDCTLALTNVFRPSEWRHAGLERAADAPKLSRCGGMGVPLSYLPAFIRTSLNGDGDKTVVDGDVLAFIEALDGWLTAGEERSRLRRFYIHYNAEAIAGL
ncbi:unnamed protein product [Vitrella brassicaformis CCMP3155]|uniref:Uncharacterized protein n=1 Tax=Vitrella brassicaformis (strain CCMP3155) TaxID=1169540 RepID=A0A0G4GGF6_VITBC|nr:unnamed protein product [Vitrella brassicaformis CCMP3155]|eukprot:CEM28705.1 unnamed protein product [Vitrella brassicaformis CCMP3155]